MKILFTPHWNRYFSYFSNEQYDVYFKEEYVYLYETPTEKPYCAVIYENDSYMLFPFLKREFTYNEKIFFDFETAYGYEESFSGVFKSWLCGRFCAVSSSVRQLQKIR